MGLSTERLHDFGTLEPWRRDALRALRLTGEAAHAEVRVGGAQQADGRFVAALRIVHVESREALHGIPMERLMDLSHPLDDATDVRVLGTLLGACAVGLRSFPTTAQVRPPAAGGECGSSVRSIARSVSYSYVTWLRIQTSRRRMARHTLARPLAEPHVGPTHPNPHPRRMRRSWRH
jgi:hypothetical protein